MRVSIRPRDPLVYFGRAYLNFRFRKWRAVGDCVGACKGEGQRGEFGWLYKDFENVTFFCQGFVVGLRFPG